MKKHIFFIDDLSKLNFKKDSTLMLALSAKLSGIETFLLFESDFFIDYSKNQISLNVTDFCGEFESDSMYLKSFKPTSKKLIELKKSDIFHFRLDPPFDSRYLRYQWMAKYLKSKAVKVINDPDAVMTLNEKMIAYERDAGIPTYCGQDKVGFDQFVAELKKSGHQDVILKPLDLFQGMGVKRVSIESMELEQAYQQMVQTYAGPIVVQPFMQAVYSGEIRAIFFNGKELGSILKVPPQGSFLANIAQGAKYSLVKLDAEIERKCKLVANEMNSLGVPWLAFDILGGCLSEVNITCPGLLVEVSQAKKENLCLTILKELENF